MSATTRCGLVLAAAIVGLPSCATAGDAEERSDPSRAGESGGASPYASTGGAAGLAPVGTSSGGTVLLSGGGQPGRGEEGDAGCTRTTSRPEQFTREIPFERTVERPIDLYVMFDSTLSTACTLVPPVLFGPPVPTRWNAFTDAMRQFVESPAAAGISVGLQYYPLQNDTCDATVYAQPDVPIALLPGNAGALVQSLTAKTPGGTTPLNAALRGAVTHARAWGQAHPDRTVAVVFTTDAAGAFPCGATALADTGAAAAEGLAGTPSIRTYVIGQVPGPDEPPCGFDVGGAPNPANIHAIAQSGGTSQALLVQTGADATAQFLAALNQIRESVTVVETRTEIEVLPVPCEWAIPRPPEGETFDPTKVNFEFSSAGTPPSTVGAVTTAGDCSRVDGGWHYDDPLAPTRIQVCPQTCTAVQGAVNAQVDIVFGCETEVAEIR